MIMNKEEFIKTATSKIYDFSKKQKIKAELSDHIQKQESFLIKIGYSSEAAEQKALENMGDAEEISREFSELYNSFYNPVPDIAAYCLWFAVLGIIYYVFNQYVYNDLGTPAICAAAIACSSAILLLFSAFSIIKKRKALAIGNIFGCLATAAFNLFSFASIDKVSNGNISNFSHQVLGDYIPSALSKEYSPLVLVFTVALFAAGLFIQIFILALSVKKEKGNNSLKTNHSLKALKKLLFSLSIASIILFGIFTLRFFAFQNNIKDEYMKNYNLAFEIANQCETQQEVIDFVNNSNYDFKESKSGGEIDGYILNGAIGSVNISFIFEEEEENTNVFERLSSIFVNAVYAKYPESKELKSEYSVNVYLSNLSDYKNGSDSISLAKLKTDEKKLDEFYDYKAKNPDLNDALDDMFIESCPVNIYFHPSKDKKRFNSEIILSYAAGYGKNSYNTDFNFKISSEKAKVVSQQKELVINTITQNPSISNEELADITGARIIDPEYSYEEFIFYLEQLQIVIDSSEELKSMLDELLETDNTELRNYADAMYNYLMDFEISDDLHFKIMNLSSLGEDEILVIFDSATNMDFVSEESVSLFKEPEAERYNTNYMSNFRKISIDRSYYCSVKGICYSDYEAVPYYTKSGSRYRYITENDKDGHELYYLVNIRGDRHEAYDCYIDKDGYLVFDDDKTFVKNQDSSKKVAKFSDSDGNQYINALEASWDENGNLLDFNAYLD